MAEIAGSAPGERDAHFLRRCFDVARRSMQNGNHPFGAILVEPFAAYGFMRTALVGIAALALANAPIGVLLLARRMSLVGDVLSHAVMPGAALGFALAATNYLLRFGKWELYLRRLEVRIPLSDSLKIFLSGF